MLGYASQGFKWAAYFNRETQITVMLAELPCLCDTPASIDSATQCLGCGIRLPERMLVA